MLGLEEVFDRLKCCYNNLVAKHASNIDKLTFDDELDCKIAVAYSLIKIYPYVQIFDQEQFVRGVNKICGYDLECCGGNETIWIGIDPICETDGTGLTTTTTTSSTTTTTSGTPSSTSTTSSFSPPPIPTTTTTSTTTTSTTTTSTTSSTSTTTPSGGGITTTTTTSTTTSSTSTTTQITSGGDLEESTYFSEDVIPENNTIDNFLDSNSSDYSGNILFDIVS